MQTVQVAVSVGLVVIGTSPFSLKRILIFTMLVAMTVAETYKVTFLFNDGILSCYRFIRPKQCIQEVKALFYHP